MILSRGHLLRALRSAPGANPKFLGQPLGYAYQPVTQPGSAERDEATANQTHKRTAASAFYTDRRPPRFWYAASCRAHRKEDLSGGVELPTIDLENTEKDYTLQPLKIQPLLNAGEWQNFWDQAQSAQQTTKIIDLPRNLKRLSCGEPVDSLIYKARKHWNHATVLIVERSDELRPLWSDMADAWKSLEQLLGEEQLDTFFLRAGPAGLWVRPKKAQSDRREIGGEHEIPYGANVFMLGAFGALNKDSPGRMEADWQRLAARLSARANSLTLLSACPLLRPVAPVYRLDKRASIGVDRFLTAMSQSWLPSVVQLRWLRKALSGSLLDELQVYNHDDVLPDGNLLELKPERLKAELKRFDQLDATQQERVSQTTGAWQDSLWPTAREIERLQQNLHRNPKPEDYPLVMRLAAITLQELQRQEPGMGFSLSHSMLLLTLPLADGPDKDEWLEVLKVAQQVADRLGQEKPLMDYGQPMVGEVSWLRQIGDALHWHDKPDYALLGLGEKPFVLSRRRDLEPVVRDRQLEIIDQDRRWGIHSLTKPGWAERIWCESGVIHAAHQTGALFQLQPAGPERPQAEWICLEHPWPWTASSGIDQFGLWADLAVGEQTQRLRWIPPGHFEMGSPVSEPERFDDEPLHAVTLSAGYWLADTACTQALWQQVMGTNPSHFSDDPECPVERISWDDCMEFIERLNRQVSGGLVLRLPSEAEWEYACRAGSKTPFSFGDTLSTRQANYDGNHPYNEGERGEHRERTLPVYYFQPNRWGLYQMHGNVWEWCADWYGDYPVEAVTDPQGPAEGSHRVLRGGSWFSYGRYLRSAIRINAPPGNRGNYIGLRLAGG